MNEDITYLENLISNRKVVRNYKNVEVDLEKLKNAKEGVIEMTKFVSVIL